MGFIELGGIKGVVGFAAKLEGGFAGGGEAPGLLQGEIPIRYFSFAHDVPAEIAGLGGRGQVGEFIAGEDERGDVGVADGAAEDGGIEDIGAIAAGAVDVAEAWSIGSRRDRKRHAALQQ